MSINQKNKKITLFSSLLVVVLIAGACAPLSAVANLPIFNSEPEVSTNENPVTSNDTKLEDDSLNPGNDIVVNPVAVAAVEGTLRDIYDEVNPSVVSIQVSTSAISSGNPLNPNEQIPQVRSALGSGFVWDKEGHIVTNNHVVDNATRIEVVFDDGTTFDATMVGADSDSDLAVIKIDADPSVLVPVNIADSDTVQVGDMAIAIGNPYGLGGTMTVGIISALGRSLQADLTSLTSSYTIPDIIQTDAAINPGNSGGVLLNASGQVIGVTSAIESPVQANVGIGFVIPSDIVTNVVPELINNGSYQHSYLGISGGTLIPDIAEAMNLDRNQRGILVATVTAGGPSDQAGIQASNETFNYQGFDVTIGGDVITAIDNVATPTFDDLVSYLASSTKPGQKVVLDIIRDGKTQQISVTLGARPTETVDNTQPPTSAFVSGQAYLGITGGSLVPEVADAMGLESNQEGVLIVDVATDSPADKAGLRSSEESFTLNGQEMKIGGDVITRINQTNINGIQSLREELAKYEPGDEVTLSILRNGEKMEIIVTLEKRP